MASTPTNDSQRGHSLFRDAHDLQVQTVEATIAGGNTISQAAPIFINCNLNTKGKQRYEPQDAEPSTIAKANEPAPPSRRVVDRRSPQWAQFFGGILERFLNPLKSPAAVGLGPQPHVDGASQSTMTTDSDLFSLVSLESLDSPRKLISKGEAYVISMLVSGKGLACWQPKPRHPIKKGQGVIPGDVGIFSVEEGFQKIFNLWEDEGSILATSVTQSCEPLYSIPPKLDNVVETREHLEGGTVVQGATSKTFYDPDGYAVTGFEFKHLEHHPKGGVLAFTSTTMVEMLTAAEQSMLFDHISQHTSLIFKHATSIQRIQDDESLYIVTGSMKSESWALAGFTDPMTPPDDVLRLIKRRGGVGQESPGVPRYVWTDKGTADGYSGTSEEQGSQDQCLFLRGFKLGFSKAFRSRMKEINTSKFGGPTARSHRKGPSGQLPRDKEGGSKRGTSGGAGHGGPGSGSGGRTNPQAGDSGISITSFPANSRAMQLYHPCDAINEYLLERTGLDFALSHDDDWIPILAGAKGVPTSSLSDLPFPDFISVLHGVASLASHEPQQAMTARIIKQGFAVSQEGSASSTSQELLVESKPDDTSVCPDVSGIAAGEPPLGATMADGEQKRCSKCMVANFSAWRKDEDSGGFLCDPCGLYLKPYSHPPQRSKRKEKGRVACGVLVDMSTPKRSLGMDEDDGKFKRCKNCNTPKTPFWRKNKEGQDLCRPCVLHSKLQGPPQPSAPSNMSHQPQAGIIRKKETPRLRSCLRAPSQRRMPSSGEPWPTLSGFRAASLGEDFNMFDLPLAQRKRRISGDR